jgi:hypothetical protein
MKRILMFLFATILLTQYLDAQTTEDSVKAVINSLFSGMKNANASLLKSAFSDSAIMQSVGKSKEGKIVIENEKIDEFAKFISNLKKGAADEQIVFES